MGSPVYWAGFLGFVALMEGFPPTPALIQALMTSTGHPVEAFRVAVERTLCLPDATLHIVDEATLRWWFEQPMKEHA